MAEFFWYFILYSFLGFVLEVLFARLTRNPKKDRKCLYFLPLCPVYGLGAVLILLLPPGVLANPLLLFPAAALLCSLAEFAMGLFYEKAARVPFWDYSHLPWNVGGKVCPLFSLMWGVLALGLVYAVHPFIVRAVRAVPPGLTLPAALFFLADAGLSLYVLRRERTADALRWYRRLPRRVRVRE